MASRPSQDAVRSLLYDSLRSLSISLSLSLSLSLSPLLICSIHGISSLPGRRAIPSLLLTPLSLHN